MVSGALHSVGHTFTSAMDATGHWLKNNWEYVAGGAMVVAGGALMITGVGGPAGAMLISAGADTIIQKATTGEVNWGEVAVSGAAGAVGFGAGGALAKTGLSVGAREVAANVAEGAVSNGSIYLTGPGPHTATGLLTNAGVGGATGGIPLRGAAGHGVESGASRLLNRTEEAVTGCFVAGTPVLLADGSSKPIEDVQVGDEVTAFNPDTGETEPRRVVDAFVHHDMPTYQVVIDDDQIVTTTAEHPFMVVGQGWTPVNELRKGDQLVRPDGTTVAIRSIDATGDTATVHNFEVDGVHNYYVQAGNQWLLVHNANCGFYYRGARPGELPSFSPRPTEYKIDAGSGYVRPTHGLSVFDNPESVTAKGFTPHEIDPSSISDRLRVIQRGQDPAHYEIVSQLGADLTPEEYVHQLSNIRTR